MRLFIATEIKIPLYQIIVDRLSPHLIGKWTLAQNLHLTHLFIGEDDPKRYQIPLKIPKEKIILKGLDLFGDRILYLKAHSKNISSINYQLTKKFNIKSKSFIPHITLCRVKYIKDKKALLDSIKKLEELEFENEFNLYLYSSTLTKKGPIYKKIYKY